MTYLNCLFCNGGYRAVLLNHYTRRIFWSSQKEQRESIQIMGTEPRCLDFQFYQLKHIIKLIEGYSSPWNSETYMFFLFLLLTWISDQL